MTAVTFDKLMMVDGLGLILLQKKMLFFFFSFCLLFVFFLTEAFFIIKNGDVSLMNKIINLQDNDPLDSR